MVIIPKVCKPELRSYALHVVSVLYICVRFRENISDGIRVMERTQIMEALTDGQTGGYTKFRRYNIYPRHFLWRCRKVNQITRLKWFPIFKKMIFRL